MSTSTRTSHQKPFARASIQKKMLTNAEVLNKLASAAITSAQQAAYNQGISDCENSTRDHPPYGFSDLKEAWRRGWLAASQRRERGE